MLHGNDKVVVIRVQENVKVRVSKKKGMKLTFALIQCNGAVMEYCPCVYAFSSDFRRPGAFLKYLKTMKAADEFFAAARMDRETIFKSIDRTFSIMFVNDRKVDRKLRAKAKAKAKAGSVDLARDTETESEMEEEDDKTSSSVRVTKKRKIANI